MKCLDVRTKHKGKIRKKSKPGIDGKNVRNFSKEKGLKVQVRDVRFSILAQLVGWTVQIIQSKLIGPWFTIKERESHLILISSSSRKTRSSLERRSAIVRSFWRGRSRS